MSEQLIGWLWRAGWQSAVLVVMVLVVQRLFRAQLSPQWRCNLWLLVVLRLLLPCSLESRLSLFNFTSPASLDLLWRPTTPDSELPDDVSIITDSASAAESKGEPDFELARGDTVAKQNLAAVPVLKPSLAQMLCPIWFGGAILLTAHALASSLRLKRRFRRVEIVRDTQVLALLAECLAEAGLHRPIRLMTTDSVSAPVLYGLWRPRLLLPTHLLDALSPGQLRYVLLHELAHIKRGDLQLNWLLTGLQILHWPNPISWFVFNRIRADREVACDAFVLDRTGMNHSKSYGETILQLVEAMTVIPRAPGLVGILENRRCLRRRIEMIIHYRTASHRPALALLLVAILSAGCLTDAHRATTATGSATSPVPLHISKFYQERFVIGQRTDPQFESLAGQRTIDGVPFQIEGHALLYGRKEANWMHRTNYPDLLGIAVGRKFDELHLIHNARWADVPGQAIAHIRLNYADGTSSELPVRYGVHVRDWQRLASEEREFLTDPSSKVIWRGTGIQGFKSTLRVFKSTFRNPHPQKLVTDIDVTSTRHMAAYELVAATVANHERHRSLTPAVSPDEPQRKFEGLVGVRILDQATGQPINGALVDPGMTVDDVVMIAPPLLTSAAGTAQIKYPLDRISRLGASITKIGYVTKKVAWTSNIPDSITFRLQPLTSR